MYELSRGWDNLISSETLFPNKVNILFSPDKYAFQWRGLDANTMFKNVIFFNTVPTITEPIKNIIGVNFIIFLTYHIFLNLWI